MLILILGMKYGLMFQKTVVAIVVKNFEIFTEYKRVEDMICIPDTILSIEGGYKLSFKART